jgi:hypothetical protein
LKVTIIYVEDNTLKLDLCLGMCFTCCFCCKCPANHRS